MGLLANASVKDQASDQALGDLVKRLEKNIAESPAAWPVGWPGSSALTPGAFGGARGMVGFGLGVQPRVRYSHDVRDGVFGVIVPVGDPVKEVGFDIIGTLTNLDNIGDRGSFDFILHKRFNDSAVAIGTERLTKWGISDSDRTVYLVGSHRFRLKPSNLDSFSRLTVSAGIGNGRFRREADVFADRKTVGLFGSASVNVVREVNAFAEWTGQDLDLGVSVAPFHSIPIVFTAAAVDLTQSAGDGVRGSFGVGYVYRFH